MVENAVGIDLGTTFSAVAAVNDRGEPEIVPNAEGERLTPSAVLFDGDQVVVGSDAKASATSYPGQVAQFFKRRMGEDGCRFVFGGRDFDPADLSACVLKKLKRDTELHLGEPVTSAVITVPAYFGDPQRRATVKAAAIAGLEVSQLVNEPTAAAYAYGLHRLGATQRALVFDLGGGTFDVTVVEISGDLIEVKATGGDHQLGGRDWDEALAGLLSERFRQAHRIDPLSPREGRCMVEEQAAQLKIALSSRMRAPLTVNFGGRSLRVELSRDEYEAVTAPLLERCRFLTEIVLSEARLGFADIDRVLLVGGATRMPMVHRMVREMSGREPSAEFNADECVALGAAVKAALLKQGRSLGSIRYGGAVGTLAKMRDVNVTSHGFGLVVLKDGALHNSVIIAKNTPFPCEKSREDFTTTYDGQETIEVVVTEGEEADPYKCNLVGHYEAHDLPPMKAGGLRVRFTYGYDVNQMVVVGAWDLVHSRPLRVRSLPGRAELSALLPSPVDVALLLDYSGSMAGQGLTQARKAAAQFLDTFSHPQGRVGLVTFPGGVRHELSRELSGLRTSLGSMSAGGGTPMAEAIVAARDVVLKDPVSKRVMVLLTDGAPDSRDAAAAEAATARRQRIRIIAVGVAGADEGFLRSVVSSASDFRWAGDVLTLSTTFGAIATELSGGGFLRRG